MGLRESTRALPLRALVAMIHVVCLTLEVGRKGGREAGKGGKGE
jgi:hypothetical protein